ncbi:hypothetical protein TP70_10065 [Staphylococcus microti]|uniref:Membrane protein n=1 Tax=Staphylococcus microti TaxID=569857 RepID=A0A0D6XP74_9STAP|nr:DUF4064 domain-containing protein [Staphylococcus microti]KIX90056.1 hypothetical protein TP70_10065 [Staphylococcus microti]PNZ82939.1 DUF4064 domain-containing protein [Staphylococcus microti]SUM57134.1 membrane protein [Staphylococcus microti]
MTGDIYTQVRRPVNRVAEKILGWLSWLLLLGTTVVAMFFGLVLFSNESSIQNFEAELANNAGVQNFLANYNMTSTELIIHLQNGVWAFIVYLIVCLLISFLGLISMNHRVISGLLFLAVAIMTLPLIFMLVPIFFFIIALMMFGRKPRLETVPMYDGFEYGRGPVYEPTYVPDSEPVQPQQLKQTVRQETVNATPQQEEEPAVMSRSAKYHHKQADTEETDVPASEQEAVTLDDTLLREDVAQAQQTTEPQDDYAYTYHTQEANVPLTKDELKQQKKEEKAQLKAERKEARKAKKAYEKEQRKNRPSASSQRRQNYEDRMKLNKERTEQAAAKEDTDTH